jgi:6-phosphofructokinase 1
MEDLKITTEQMNIEHIGPARIDNPTLKANACCFIHESDRVLYEDVIDHNTSSTTTLITQVSMERSGPREKIYFDPSKTKAGIVTCGGLCPGINDVIRAVTMALSSIYGVRRIVGFKYGYEGFIAEFGHEIVDVGRKPAGASLVQAEDLSPHRKLLIAWNVWVGVKNTPRGAWVFFVPTG